MTRESSFAVDCPRCGATGGEPCHAKGNPLSVVPVHAARRATIRANRPNLTPDPNRPTETL